MHKIFLLYKAIKNGSDTFNTSSNAKWANNKLLQYGLTAALLVVLTVFGYQLLDNLYSTLGMMEVAVHAVLIMFFQIGSILTLVMCVLWAPSQLFMGDDNKILLPLPVRPWELLLAKMMVLYSNLLQILAMFAIPVFIGTGLVYGYGPTFYLYGLLTTLVTPCIPLAFACLLSILMISVVPFRINKDVITFVGTALILGSVIVFNAITNSGNEQALLDFFIEGKLTGVLSYVLPNINLSLNLFKGTDIALSLGLLILIFAACFGVIAFGFQMPFYKSLSKLQDTFGYKKRKTVEKDAAQQGQFSAYFKKEWRMMIRTTSNITYLFLMGIYMPLVLGVVVMFNGEIKELLSMINFDATSITWLVWVVLGVMAYQCGITQAGLTAISREGKNAYIMKYLPIPVKTQLLAKLSTCLLVFIIPLALLFGLFIFLVQPPALLLLQFILCAALLVLATTLIEMFLDIKSPKLTWMSEQQMFGGIRMLIPLAGFSVGFAGFCFLMNLLGVKGHLLILALDAFLLVLSAIFYKLTIKEDALKRIE